MLVARQDDDDIYIYIKISWYVQNLNIALNRVHSDKNVLKSLKKIHKKRTFSFGHFSTENCDNRFCTRRRKNVVVAKGKSIRGEEKHIEKMTVSQQNWYWHWCFLPMI